MTSRRRFLAATAALPVVAVSPRLVAGERTLELATPPGLPAVIMKRLVDQQTKLAGYSLALRTWRNPDQLRAWVAGQQVDASTAPTNVAANLFNRGAGFGLLDVTVWGMLHVLLAGGSDDAGLDSLLGQRIGIPFRDDMPDVVFRRLLQTAGIDPKTDLKIVYLGTPMEAAQMFLARQLEALVLPEPAATLVRQRSQVMNLTLGMIDLQKVWAEQFNTEPRLPQAGMLCETGLARDDPGLGRALTQASADALASVTADPRPAAEAASELTGLSAAAVVESLGRARLRHQTASAARPALDAFFERLHELQPELIGGKVPGDGFYLA